MCLLYVSCFYTMYGKTIPQCVLKNINLMCLTLNTSFVITEYDSRKYKITFRKSLKNKYTNISLSFLTFTTEFLIIHDPSSY